jgi:hypothetical protein
VRMCKHVCNFGNWLFAVISCSQMKKFHRDGRIAGDAWQLPVAGKLALTQPVV